MIDLRTLAVIAVILIAICLIFSILFHMMRAAVVFFALMIIIPATCTIMWGDGEEIVSGIASIFTPAIEEQINDGYKIYHDANSENPVVDMEQLESYFEQIKDKIFGDREKEPVDYRVFPLP